MEKINRITMANRLQISLPTLKKRTDAGEFETEKNGNRLFYLVNDNLPATSVAIPTINELITGSTFRALTLEQEQQRELMVLLNTDPPAEWLETHPMAKTLYLPIAKLEYLLSAIFTAWWVEVIFPPQLLGNSIVVTVRLFVTNPVTGEVEHQDGVGGAPVQTDAGATPTAIDAMKSNGVMLAAPMAETYAIKDAAEKFGKLFGKDLNRKETINYNVIVKKKTAKTPDQMEKIEIERLMSLIDCATTSEHLEGITDDVMNSNDPGLITELAKKVKKLKKKK